MRYLPAGAQCPSADATEEYFEASGELNDECGHFVGVVDGPELDPILKKCCYTVERTQQSCTIEGRPLVIDGRAVTAQPRCAVTWLVPGSPALAGLSEEERAELAEAWTSGALFEHASIASFGRFSLELLALGAPAALVEAAHLAALDEVRHAQLSFGLAAAYRGAPIGPSALPLSGRLALAPDLVGLAIAVAHEACIGETLAALVAAERLARASDPAVRSVLAAIADDEARHAELAWRTLAWAIGTGGATVRSAVALVFRDADESPVPESPASSGDRLAAHGVIGAGEERSIMARGLREIVLPCARAVLAAAAAPPPPWTEHALA